MAEQMPDMRGANMGPEAGMDPRAREAMMQPDEEIAAVLLARLTSMSPQELQMLDKVITPEVARILTKLLPELAQLIDAVEGQQAAPQQAAPQMGALGGM